MRSQIVSDYEQLSVIPTSGILGAEVTGRDRPLDLADLDETTFAELHRAWLDHRVLFFRDQDLTIEQLEAFTERWGEFGDNPFVEPMAGHPAVVEVLKEAHETDMTNFGGGWHCDWSFMETPPSATILYAREIPAWGGDTLFADLERAWETLSPSMQDLLHGIQAVHSARRSYAPTGSLGDGDDPRRTMKVTASETAYDTTLHPLVRTHVETGRKSLWVNGIYTIGLDGFTPAESTALLGFLIDHTEQQGFTCRFRWAPGSLAMWDNRCVQHNALNDYDGHRRLLWRTTVRGERPS
jgi:taurine dioxygenase